MGSPLRSLGALALLASAAQAADVLVVDDDGGPGVFASLDAAIGAAGEGDVLLLRDGTYGGGAGLGQVIVDGQGLELVAERGASVRVEGLALWNLGRDQTVRIRGIELVGNTLLPPLWVDDAAGTVWVEDCSITGVTDALAPPLVTSHGAFVVDSANVVFARCTITGGLAGSAGTQAGSALEARDAVVHLYDCGLTGGFGNNFTAGDTGPGGVALNATSSFVYAQRTTFTGGDGGLGNPFGLCSDGADGGAGARLTGAGSELVMLASVAAGGAFGDGTAPCAPGIDGVPIDLQGGSLRRLPGAGLGLAIAGPARAGEVLDVVVTGRPGDTAWLVVAGQPAPRFEPLLSATRLFSRATRRTLLLGTIGAGGTLTVSFPAPALGGAEARTFFTQILGQTRHGLTLGSGQALTVLHRNL